MVDRDVDAAGGRGVKWGQNFALVSGLCLGLLGVFWVFLRVYEPLLGWVLDHKLAFSMGACVPGGVWADSVAWVWTRDKLAA